MKKSALIATLAALGFTSAASAQVAVIPRASLGFAAYSLDIPLASGGSQKAATSSYGTLGAGLTVAADNFYVAIDTTTSMGGEHDLYNTTGGDFSRDDTAFTVGVTTAEGFQFFGGYKTGKTEFKTPTLTMKTTTFDTSGPFLGLGFSSATGDSTLSFNLAVAMLEGELKDNDTFFLPYNAKSGSTVGFSMGINWSTALSERTRLSVGGKYEIYAYQDWEDPNYNIPDMNESIFSMNVGLSYRF